MKINLINNYDSLYKMHNSKCDFLHERKDESAGQCVDKKVNSVYNSGSSVSFGAAANFSSKVMTGINKLWDLSAGSTVVAQNLVALVLAGVLRPIAITSLPGDKNKDDKIYASGHAIASGIIGFIFSSIIMYPFDRAAKFIKKDPKKYLTEISKKIYKVENLEELQNSKIFQNVEKIFNMSHDAFVFSFVKAMLTVALIPPILKYVFGVEKGKGSKNTVQPVVNNYFKTPDMKAFLGGNK